MKPVQIVLLVVAGALGGAVLTTQIARKPKPPQQIAAVPSPQPAAPAPVVTPPATPAAPATTAAAEPEPMPEARKAAEKPSPVAPPAPSPAPPRRVIAKPRPVTHPAPPPAHPRPVETARVDPAPVPQPAAPPAAPAPAGSSVGTPEPVSTPPARPEPEHETPAAPPPAPPAPQVTLTAGMLLPVRLVDGLSSERNLAGDTFTGTLDRELAVDGFVIAERGARVEGRVTSVDRGGKVKGVSAMAIELTRIHLSDGQTISIRTDPFERRAEASHQADAAKVGAGAAVGAIIGAIAGGGKGAAIGAGVGGGAGAGDVLLTRGKPVTFPSELRLSFRLSAPVTVTERR